MAFSSFLIRNERLIFSNYNTSLVIKSKVLENFYWRRLVREYFITEAAYPIHVIFEEPYLWGKLGIYLDPSQVYLFPEIYKEKVLHGIPLDEDKLNPELKKKLEKGLWDNRLFLFPRKSITNRITFVPNLTGLTQEERAELISATRYDEVYYYDYKGAELSTIILLIQDEELIDYFNEVEDPYTLFKNGRERKLEILSTLYSKEGKGTGLLYLLNRKFRTKFKFSSYKKYNHYVQKVFQDIFHYQLSQLIRPDELLFTVFDGFYTTKYLGESITVTELPQSMKEFREVRFKISKKC